MTRREHPFNPPGFQYRVDELMRDGRLFGESVWQARREFFGEDEAFTRRSEASRVGWQHWRDMQQQVVSGGA